MKNIAGSLVTIITVLGLTAQNLFSAPNENFKVFLCFGQSNMSGGAGVGPDAESQKSNPRIKVLAFANCSNPQRTANEWADAFEPMHCGDGVSAMGPSYEFAKALIDSLPATDTIGLIPCGLWGVSIEMFMKGKSNTSGNKPSMIGNNAWDWMVTKCKKAVERGVFSGIILHQGEANSGQQDWPNKVKSIYDGLKSELNLTRDVPLVAGELLNSSHNSIVAKIPQTLPYGYVASSSGLSGGGTYPSLHFNQDGYRKMGQRMAVQMAKGLKDAAETKVKPRQRVITNTSTSNMLQNVQIYSLNGKFVSTETNLSTARTSVKPGSIYIVSNKATGTNAKLMIVPSGR